MAMLPNRIEEFNLLVDELNRRMALQKKGIGVGKERLLKLHAAGFHFEAFLINCQLVEEALKGLLRTFELKRNAYDACGLPDPYPHIDNQDRNRKTLGKNIEVLARFVGESQVISHLRDFNDKRMEFVHHSLGGLKDSEQLDAEAELIVTQNEFFAMVIGLGEIQVKIQAEMHALYQ